jgi:phosphohistidine phosphatase
MKTLLLMRHAKSSRDDPSLPDRDRPLNKRGKTDAPRMGRLLREQDLTPDLIVSSPATRALATAEAVAAAFRHVGDIRVAPDLYPGDSSIYARVLREIPEEIRRVLVVGHNPAIERFLGELTRTTEVLPTATVAVVELPLERWKGFTARTRGALKAIWRPREIE